MNTLDTLPLHRPSATQSRDLLRVLVFAAAARLSVQQAYDQLERAPSGPTVLGNLACQCSDLDTLEGHVNALLARLIPKGLGKRGHHVAVDVVALPSQGTVEEAHQDEVYRSKAKGGTTHFFRLCRKFCSGGREGAVAPNCGGIKRPVIRTFRP